MPRSIPLLAVAVALLGNAPRATAKCAYFGLAPKVLTPANLVIPSDGGVVVAAVDDAHARLDPGDAAVQSGWRLRIGSDRLRPPIDLLAPGLAVYRVGVANAFKVELEDADHAVVATVRPKRAAGEAIAAPKIKRIWFVKPAEKMMHTRSQVGVELDGAVPAGVIAMILADEHGTPRSWTLASGTTLYPYDSESCRPLPNGTIASTGGDTITLAWVDASGRVSAASAPLVIPKS